jgi:hypothetical protein
MTAMDRFDQRVAGLIEDVAAPRYPDYFDDVLDVAVRRPQRPAWTFPERWLPMSAIARRPAFVPAFVPGSVGLLLLLGLLIAAILAVAVGTQRRLPPPYGPAANGSLTYSEDGDIYGRNLVTGTENGRYWNEHDGRINHQVWVASLAGDGSDAVAVGPLHRSRGGHNPFSYAFAPDGTSVIIQMNEVPETWQANPAGGQPLKLQWGRTVGDWIDWQRLAP